MYPLALLFVSWCAGVLTEEPHHYDLRKARVYFEEFVAKYNKSYRDNTETNRHFEIFLTNLAKVNRLNEEENANVFGISQFMDLNRRKFLKHHSGFRYMTYDDYCTVQTDEHIPDTDVPETFDWRQKNIVTEVGEQEECADSFAFSTAGVLEGQYAIHYKELVSLSKQQLTDCDSLSDSCCGGFPGSAIKSVIEGGGIMTESDYLNLRNRRLDAHLNPCIDVNGFKVQRCFSWNIKSQEKVKQLLYTYGPISIAIEAEAVMYYDHGIIHKCNNEYGSGVNHAVLLVGYGVENDIPYWIVKNSWGTNWGESGYFRMLRGEGVDSCGMLSTYLTTAEIA